MKSALRKSIWFLFAAVAIAIVARTYWVCSQVDGGRLLWRHLAAGLPPIMLRPELPDDKIWFKAKLRLLDEANRIGADPNSTAEDCMGAAWLISCVGLLTPPDPAIIGRMAWCAPPKNTSADEWRALDRSNVARAQQLAAKATRLEPENLAWWRLQAVLMSGSPPYTKPVDYDRESLEQGAARDPDNAIYGYLLAAKLLNRAFPERDANQEATQPIADRDLFELGRQQYERASQKPVLRCGEEGYRCAARLLAKLNAPLELKVQWNNHVGFEEATGDLIDRIEIPLDKSNSDNLPEAEAAEFKAWLDKHATWRKQIAMSPPCLWLQDRMPPAPTNMTPKIVTILRREALLDAEDDREMHRKLFSVAGVAFAVMAAMLLALAALSWIGVRLLRSTGSVRAPTGFVAAPIILFILTLLTFGFIGMVGAYRPEVRQYPWPIGIGLTAIGIFFLSLVGLLCRFVWRQTWLPTAHRATTYQPARLALVIVVSLIFLIALFWTVDYKFRGVAKDLFFKFPSVYLSAENGVDYVAAEALGIRWRSLAYAGLEWCFRGCAVWTVGLTVLALVLLGYRRSRTETATRQRLSRSFSYAVKSSLWLVCLLILAALAASSQAIDDLSTQYARDFSRLEDYAWLLKMAAEKERQLPLNPLTP